MPTDSSAIVSKIWNYPPSLSELWRASAHVLKNAGVGYDDTIEQMTYLPLIYKALERIQVEDDLNMLPPPPLRH